MIPNHYLRQTTLLATVIVTLLATLLTPATGLAQASEPTTHALIANDTARGVTLMWSAASDGEWSAAAVADLLPHQLYGGYNLPLQTYTLLLEDERAVELEIQKITARPLADTLTPAPVELPPALDWEPDPNLASPPRQLPTAPVFIVRQGNLRGVPIAVVAVSPVYEEDGVVKVAESVHASVPGATLFDSERADAARKTRAASLRATPVTVPVNSDALRAAHKLIVSQAGIQEVTFAELGGVSNPDNLRLTFKGAEVALEVLSDRLRFYAPPPGDRWNTTDVYWLTSSTGSRARMVTLPEGPASQDGVAYTRGVWLENLVYDSVYAGHDADHWFHADMRTDPTMSALTAPTATVSAPSPLPLIDASGQFSVNVTVWLRPPDSACRSNLATYRIDAKLGSSESTILWNPAPGCQLQQNWSLPVTLTGTSQALQVKLMPSTHPLGIKLDSMNWQRPVRLDFGGQGADFWTDAGAWNYTWSNLPSDTPVGAFRVLLPVVMVRPGSTAATAAATSAATTVRAAAPAATATVPWQLYDVTVPLRPALVTASATGFSQADSTVPRHYVLANLAGLGKPTVIAQQAVNFGDPLAADAIYIGPAQFADELEPLFVLRRSQGYKPLFVDVAAIQDVYGYGHVSATALRNFLRHRTDWQNVARQISVVLVGDGTYDPRGYQGILNDNLVTPYMAEVDPFIREVPCEPCFAQLHGDDPVTGDNVHGDNGSQIGFFAADVWLGRFPVRNEAELTTVVGKIVAYETQGGMEDKWRKQHVFMADNYITELDANNNAKVDEAGDFGTITDELIQEMPHGIKPTRIYYDPAPNRIVRKNSQGSPVQSPSRPDYMLTDARWPVSEWQIADSQVAHDTVVQELSKGAGLVFYNGHSNHFQYARTYTGSENLINYLMNTNTANFSLTNADKPFIMLAMTCYTSQFARPTNVGVLDEILFRRAGGGAVAVWGPAGLTVAHGHDRLQQGFMHRLWEGETMNTPLGALAEAGYDELLTVAPLNLDAVMTFLLTGDPLTKARVYAETSNYLPLVNK